MFKKVLFFLLLAIFLAAAIFYVRYKQKLAFTPGFKLSHPVERIAHAGGGINTDNYTNSLDALNLNADKYTLFELDFQFTKDGELVCIHDWRGAYQDTFGQLPGEVPTLAEFEALVAANPKYKNGTYKTLRQWMDEHPDKIVVTDIKDDNLRGLEFIAKHFENYQDRFIPQIYFPQEYEQVKKLGYKKIIWTLYRYHYPDPIRDILDTLLADAQAMDLYAITMPKDRADYNLGGILGDRLGIPTYVHTVNKPEEVEKYRKLGITEIYTDWLPPNH